MPEIIMLSTTEIIRRTGWDKDALGRFQREPTVREWLGGKESHPNYPEANLPLFVQMKEAYEKNIKPKAFAAVIALPPSSPNKPTGTTEEPTSKTEPLPSPQPIPMAPAYVYDPDAEADDANDANDAGGASTALVPLAQRLMKMTEPEVGDALKNAAGSFATELAKQTVAELQKAGVIPKQKEHFLTREQAAEMLACLPSAVGRRVRPVQPNTWAESHVQAYMERVIHDADERHAAQDMKRQERKARKAHAAAPDAETTASETP